MSFVWISFVVPWIIIVLQCNATTWNGMNQAEGSRKKNQQLKNAQRTKTHLFKTFLYRVFLPSLCSLFRRLGRCVFCFFFLLQKKSIVDRFSFYFCLGFSSSAAAAAAVATAWFFSCLKSQDDWLHTSIRLKIVRWLNSNLMVEQRENPCTHCLYTLLLSLSSSSSSLFVLKSIFFIIIIIVSLVRCVLLLSRLFIVHIHTHTRNAVTHTER